jgi:hypothetical protein
MLVGPAQEGRVLTAIVLQSQKEVIDNMERNFVIIMSGQMIICVLLGVIAACQFLRANRAPNLVGFFARVVVSLSLSIVSMTLSSVDGMNSPREFLRLLGVCDILKSDMSSEDRSFIPKNSSCCNSLTK